MILDTVLFAAALGMILDTVLFAADLGMILDTVLFAADLLIKGVFTTSLWPSTRCSLHSVLTTP